MTTLATTFAELDLIEPLQRALIEQNYKAPTPIQAQAIPPLLAERDVLGCAQTGTGKTAAFALPVLQHMAEVSPSRGKRHIRALVLTPTRELAAQIAESFATYGRYLPVEHLVIFGGVNENPQIRALRKGVDVLIATPGRLLDLLGRGYMHLGDVEFFVLDEADRMLDMGFVHDVRKVIKVLPNKRQNLLFSATMPPSIITLAGTFLHNPVQIEVTPETKTVEAINQKVMFVENPDKKRLLAQILTGPDVGRAIVFTRTKRGANRLSEQLVKVGIEAAAIHGNKSQNARNRALAGFRNGEIPVLVATDLAARGIDVDGVTHVVNYDLPNEPEVYVHRIGRTGRAGKSGIAIAFCGPTEAGFLRSIESLIGLRIPQDLDHEYHCADAMPRARSAGGNSERPRSHQPPRRRGGPPAQARKRRGPSGPRGASSTDGARGPGRSGTGRGPGTNSGAAKRSSGAGSAGSAGGGAGGGAGAANKPSPSGARRRRRRPPRS